MKAPTFSADAIAWGGLVLLALIWGSSFILIKRGVAVYPPAVIGGLRVALAGIALLPFALHGLGSIPPQRWHFLVVVGLFGNLLPAYFFSKAETQLSSSVTGVLNALTPLCVLLVGVLLFAQPFRLRKLYGLLLAFGGAAALAWLGGGQHTSWTANAYALYVLLATLCYGISANTIKFRLQGLRAIEITSSAFLTMLPLSLAYLVFSDFGTVLATHPQAWQALGFITVLAVVGTAFALVIFNYLIQVKSPVFATAVTYLIPIVAIAWGVLDGETLVSGQFIAIAVILFQTQSGKPNFPEACPKGFMWRYGRHPAVFSGVNLS